MASTSRMRPPRRPSVIPSFMNERLSMTSSTAMNDGSLATMNNPIRDHVAKRLSITPLNQSSTITQIDEGNRGFNADGDIISFANSLQWEDGERLSTIGVKITIPALFKVDLTRKQFTARIKVVLIYSAELLADPASNLMVLFVNSIGTPLQLEKPTREVMSVLCRKGKEERRCDYIYLQTLYEADFTISCAVKISSTRGSTMLQKEFHSTVSDFPFDSHLCFVGVQLSPANDYSEAFSKAFNKLTPLKKAMVFAEATNLAQLASPNKTDWLDTVVAPFLTQNPQDKRSSAALAGPTLYNPNNVIQDFEVVSNEWQVLLPDDSFRCFKSGTSYRPKAQLRFHIMRKSEYYLWNGFALIFFVVSMTFPTIGIDPADVANRLQFLVTIALTVIALKFSLTDKMPLSDRSNWLDTYINYGILTCLGMMIMVSMVGSIERDEEDSRQNTADRACFFLICIAWCGYTLHLIYRIRRKFVTHLDGEALSEDGLGRCIHLDYSEDILGRTKEWIEGVDMDKKIYWRRISQPDRVVYENPMMSALSSRKGSRNDDEQPDVVVDATEGTEGSGQAARPRPPDSAAPKALEEKSKQAHNADNNDSIPAPPAPPVQALAPQHRNGATATMGRILSVASGECGTTTEESLGTLDEGEDEDEDDKGDRNDGIKS